MIAIALASFALGMAATNIVWLIITRPKHTTRIKADDLKLFIDRANKSGNRAF